MTIITYQLEELKLVQEDLEAASTILANQPRENRAKYGNNKYQVRYLVPRLLNSESLPLSKQTHHFSPIEEQSKNSQDDIAIHALVHPINRENASSTEASTRRRTGKFTNALISHLSTDSLNLPFNILKKSARLQAQRHQELQTYLDSLRDEARSAREPEFSERVINIAWLVWVKLREYFMNGKLYLEVPDACPGQKDNFMYTWSKGEHYLECEIFGSGEIEFFYRNRETGKNWGEDVTIRQVLSPVILEKVKLFIQ